MRSLILSAFVILIGTTQAFALLGWQSGASYDGAAATCTSGAGTQTTRRR